MEAPFRKGWILIHNNGIIPGVLENNYDCSTRVIWSPHISREQAFRIIVVWAGPQSKDSTTILYFNTTLYSFLSSTLDLCVACRLHLYSPWMGKAVAQKQLGAEKVVPAFQLSSCTLRMWESQEFFVLKPLSWCCSWQVCDPLLLNFSLQPTLLHWKEAPSAWTTASLISCRRRCRRRGSIVLW